MKGADSKGRRGVKRGGGGGFNFVYNKVSA